MLRDRVVGDIADINGDVDYDYLDAIAYVADAAGVPLFSYTHMWDKIDLDKLPPNYVMNASTESVADAERAVMLGFPTVITSDNVEEGAMIAGKRVVTCPAQTREGVTCQSCKLCSKPQRKSVVRFLVHGIARNKARKAIDNA